MEVSSVGEKNRGRSGPTSCAAKRALSHFCSHTQSYSGHIWNSYVYSVCFFVDIFVSTASLSANLCIWNFLRCILVGLIGVSGRA